MRRWLNYKRTLISEQEFTKLQNQFENDYLDNNNRMLKCCREFSIMDILFIRIPIILILSLDKDKKDNPPGYSERCKKIPE